MAERQDRPHSSQVKMCMTSPPRKGRGLRKKDNYTALDSRSTLCISWNSADLQYSNIRNKKSLKSYWFQTVDKTLTAHVYNENSKTHLFSPQATNLSNIPALFAVNQSQLTCGRNVPYEVVWLQLHTVTCFSSIKTGGLQHRKWL